MQMHDAATDQCACVLPHVPMSGCAHVWPNPTPCLSTRVNLSFQFGLFPSANPSNFNLVEGLVDYVGIILSIIGTCWHNGRIQL